MTDIQVRRLVAGDIPAAAALTARIFATEEELAGTTALLEAAYTSCPYMPPELCWGAFVDGRLAAKWQVLDFRVRVAGNAMRVAGIQGVVAAPDDNFKGYPMLIARQGWPELASEGFPIVMGFAQRGGLYTKLGAVPLAPEYGITIDPRSVPPLAEADDDFHELASEADIRFVLDVYNATNEGRSGSFVRTFDYWPWMVRKPDVHWLNEDGYIGVIDQKTHLEIKEVGGRSAAFYDRAVRKLSALARALGHDRVSGRIPPDHPFCDAARRYGIDLKTSVPKRSGCIGIVLNPGTFVDELGPGLEARHAALGLAPLHVRFAGAGFDATLELGTGAGSVEKVDLAVPSSALLQWSFGIRSVESSLVEYGCEVRAEAVSMLSALFPVSCPFTWGSDRF